MGWPQSQDYNEAIQNARTCFKDAELSKGQAATNALGMPMPCSGNFADVYQIHCPATRTSWAVKCFTRGDPNALRQRYAHIDQYLQQARLPFTVGFRFLEEGIRVRNQWHPVLKMQWVEGLTLNHFVRDNLDKPTLLDALLQIWVRMAKRLREANLAHADLQHGNVLLVRDAASNSVNVKLIDYDGMWVPALARMRSGEVGHPAYQHPQRLREGIYSQEVDRFPLLVIATALRCLRVAGRPLWEKFDNGDNLLFREDDLAEPERSPLFVELAQVQDAQARRLIEAVRLAIPQPLNRTAQLDDLFADKVTGAKPLPIEAALVTPPAPSSAARPPVALFVDLGTESVGKGRVLARRTGGGLSWRNGALLGGIATVVLVAVLVLARGKKDSTQENGFAPKDTPPEPAKWVDLFNGKDLTGWKTFAGGTGNWKVKDKVLFSGGPGAAQPLFTERDDFENFHLRLEMMCFRTKVAGQKIRASHGPGVTGGYYTQTDASGKTATYSGSLFRIRSGGVTSEPFWMVRQPSESPDDWFTQEFIADGPRITVRIKGQPVVDFVDAEHFSKKGRIELHNPEDADAVRYRSIRVKTLPASARDSPINLIGLLANCTHDPGSNWQVADGTLDLPARTKAAGVVLPISLPRDYQFVIQAERKEGLSGLVLYLPVADRVCGVILDEKGVSALDVIERVYFANNFTARKDLSFPANRAVEIRYEVKPSSLRVTFDGQEVYRFTEIHRLTNPTPSRIPYFHVNAGGRFQISRIEYTPLAKEKPTDLLRHLDVGSVPQQGTWRKRENVLSSSSEDTTAWIGPIAKPPESYSLELDVERVAGNDALIVGLPTAGRSCMVVLDGLMPQGHLTRLEAVNGRFGAASPAFYRGTVLNSQKRCKVECVVRPGAVSVVADGQKILDWQGNPQQLDLAGMWASFKDKELFLGSHRSEFRIHRMTLTSQ